MSRAIERLQPIGRALMLPIAVLPVAGLLLRLGQADLLGIPFIAASGNAIFSNLGLLFAIGVAVGLARENHGAAGLAGVVCFLVATEGGKALMVLPSDIALAQADGWRSAEMGKLSTPAGILAGLVSGWLYNRYSTISGPAFLSFFTGRRFVPIAAGAAGLLGALLLGEGFQGLETAIATGSHWVMASGSLGLFLYGVLNRLLLVTGLHHILNNVAWFILGDFHGVTGDLKRFFAGDPAAGGFMSGFFPIMMFGLPAACLAFYRTARPEKRAEVGGMLLSLAATSFLTGVTEPIEFSFMFLAPMLYVIHSIMTGLSMVAMDALGIKLGFGFSAGLIDYLLNFGLATRPLMLIPVGLVYGLLYYGVFTWAIRRFDLATPGREFEEESVATQAVGVADRGEAFARALGGARNLTGIDACTTRLRLTVADVGRVDDGALKALGARGVLKPGGQAVQVVLGPIADSVASEIRLAAKHGARNSGAVRPVQAPKSDVAPYLAGLGGEGNVIETLWRGSRLICVLRDTNLFAEAHLPKEMLACAWPADNTVHILIEAKPSIQG